MFYLTLDELPELTRALRWFQTEKSAVCVFRDSDHLPVGDSESVLPLQERVRQIATIHGIERKIEKIRLLANVRILGYVFNPVCFFFCYDENGEPVCCICEVTNTFGEKKAYVLKPTEGQTYRDRQKKFFYVSPFTELEQSFEFELHAPGDELMLHIDTLEGENDIVKSGIAGRRLPLSDANIARMLLRYPFATLQVIFFIHFHALLLWLKRVPYHRKEERPDLQTSTLTQRTANGASGRVK